jgi:hypothetical protein
MSITFRSIALALCALVIVGCQSSRQTQSSNAGDTSTDRLQEFESEFRPSDLDPAPAHKNAARADSSGREGGMTEDSSVNAPAELVSGFRVQIFATPNIDEARAKMEEAEGQAPGEWFYLEYDAPSYKIRAGNFLTRFDADRFTRQMIDKGFLDSWSVPTRVLKNPGVRSTPSPVETQQPK